MRIIAFAVALTLVSPVFGQARYSEAQLQLARHVGAAIRMQRTCGDGVQIPTANLARALRSAGLKDRDFVDGSTVFRQAAQDQANTIAAIEQVRRNLGSSERDIAADSCRLLLRNYGPRGTIRAGLAVAK